ncbi:hypothetical protein MHLP_02040 [Candidatus Mycoplasma haematolamae str. Purdue]|uniref:Uncharacterized protein n=1 Tax=Mycoplasma haematolamae (strain Purdue) TaxID=1212765 RepID=I7BJG5_MYCHA|nr:hypothetical protein [Candidatus Mycoplasma haematolamae]AFO51988.1 hypothetical protein MHLP_02040 [Candidatus Mycoplasma haematolamae str. Purdue]
MLIFSSKSIFRTLGALGGIFGGGAGFHYGVKTLFPKDAQLEIISHSTSSSSSPSSGSGSPSASSSQNSQSSGTSAEVSEEQLTKSLTDEQVKQFQENAQLPVLEDDANDLDEH